MVLHLGDRDKAGEDIWRVLVGILPRLSNGWVSEVVRVALTPEQVAEFGLGDPRESVQVDALAAPLITSLLVDAITARQDPVTRQAVIEQEAEDRAELIEWAAG